jgi:hypothetical protein
MRSFDRGSGGRVPVDSVSGLQGELRRRGDDCTAEDIGECSYQVLHPDACRPQIVVSHAHVPAESRLPLSRLRPGVRFSGQALALL